MKQKILVVDDEPGILELTEMFLENSGYEVVTAADGAEAVDKADNAAPDLVLLDIRLPRIDGFGVIEHIRKEKTSKDLPVIFMTADTSIDKNEALSRYQANDFITKPFGMNEVIEKIESYF